MTEKQLHKQITDYILLQYPKVIFNTDSSGIKLSMGQAVQMKKLRSGNGFPDITIYEKNLYFNALFLEVKKETPFKKDGQLKKNKHLKEQSIMHVRLEDRGYRALFVWNFKGAKVVIDSYLHNK